ncbi:hypothetical protein RJ640_005156 [Escallonia rubra]|uniref:Protein CHROMATIN REMODELING 24 n=1 Tax=Escallonia rubra TaxID=112253 RepID=A0AA88RYL4_9ASTE|nr:hypothetical protein RJ640_005156 [Escallonia rubra]
MAEKKKEPLSLNQRHDRLIQDLSASHPKHSVPASSIPPHTVTVQSNACKASSKSDLDNDLPQFSGFSDLDSPSPVNEKLSYVEIESTNLLKKGNTNYDNIDSRPIDTELSKDKVDGRKCWGTLSRNKTFSKIDDDHANRPKFDGLASSKNVDSQPAEDSPLKVKIKGKRRLCKVPSNNDHQGLGQDITSTDEPNFSAISDFDSPPPVKNVEESVNGGGNEIRDILNDLSSRLEILSIEKRRPPKTSYLVGDSSELASDKGIQPLTTFELPKYSSAAPSFGLTSDHSNFSLDATGQSGVGNGFNTLSNEFEKENKIDNDSECDLFVSGINRAKKFGGGPKKYEAKKSGGEKVSKAESYDSNFVEKEDSGDDDCMVASGKSYFQKVKRHGKLRPEVDDSDEFDISDDCAYNSVSGDGIYLSGPVSTYKLPGKIVKMLYPHQRDGLKWLWSLHCQGKGGILGDDMGLGKTMQICGFIAGLFNSFLIKRALIVAPKTLLPHWIKELTAVGLSEKTREYFGACAKARQYELQYVIQDKGVLLTTYDIVRNNAKSLSGDFYFHDDRSDDETTWDYLILDEGHLIKNPTTQRAKSLLEIPSAHRIIISGTPLQNNLKELWALFNFCCPELLGDKKWFKERYEAPILRGNEKNASDRDKRNGSAVAKDLRERIQPYFLRRMKNEVFRENDDTNIAKLSKKSDLIVWLRLTTCQRQLYEAFLKSELVLSAFDGSPLAALTMFVLCSACALFTYHLAVLDINLLEQRNNQLPWILEQVLKKICDHPLLLTKRAAEDVLEGMDSMLKPEDHGVAEKLAMHIADLTERFDFEEKHDSVSCKISFIMSLLDSLIPEGHNVLIFSQTRKMLNHIQESLASQGYKFLRIDGTTKASDRVRIVNDFQEGDVAPIFLLTSQVGGLGLTLTKADRVIVVDPAWNPSTDNQSVDRAYRIGQKKDVIVYRLMTCGTVEEKIYRKQIFKGGLFKSATEHKEQIRYFSQQDLRELFSLPKQGFDISLTQQQLHEEHDCQHTMDEYMKVHIEFLKTFGIGGVSHHSLLFSKTAPAPVVQDEEVTRLKRTTFAGSSSSHYLLERNSDGAEYAFNPKDVKLQGKSSPRSNASKPTEAEIQERIKRLSLVFANKAMVSHLPDKGERIQKQIAELNRELSKIQMIQKSEIEVIDLDDVAGKLQRVLNV